MTGNPEEATVESEDTGDAGAGGEPGESAVLAYIARHPEFLVDNVEFLKRLVPAREWTGEPVVDLQAVMMDRTQEAIDDLRSSTRHVIETSRSNMSVQTRTHEAVLVLLAASDMDAIVAAIAEDWPRILDVDTVTLGFEFDQMPERALSAPDLRHLPAGTVRALLGADRNVRLYGDMTDDGTLFGEAAGLVHSAAVARIDAGTRVPAGLLSFGSRDPLFAPGQGTELITFLADVLAACIKRCLPSGTTG